MSCQVCRISRLLTWDFLTHGLGLGKISRSECWRWVRWGQRVVILTSCHIISNYGSGAVPQTEHPQEIIPKKRLAEPYPEDHWTLRKGVLNLYSLRVGNSCAFLKEIPSLKLTGHPKRKVIIQPSIFRCYVSFR